MAIPPEASLFLGSVIATRYEVTRFRANGAFSFVFEGRDEKSGDHVAIKVLKPGSGPKGHIEFDSEVRFLRRLQGASHVVSILDDGNDFVDVLAKATGASVKLPVRFMVLELAESDLETLVVNRSEISWEDRLRIFRDVVKGIHQMHLSRVIHRDLKSDNILVFLIGKTMFICRVADLGRSRLVTEDSRFTADEYIAGRGELRFAPPELLWLQGRDDPHVWRRADLYLCGSILFELATGQCFTMMAFGNPSAVIREAMSIAESERPRVFKSKVAELRAKAEHAYEIFAQEVPPSIRLESLQLIRQLTNPNPAMRDPLSFGQSKENPWSLNWLLRRVDILSTRFGRAEWEAERIRKRREKRAL